MEHYDVVIIGAGIAGCGLAYNLNKMGYNGSVLVIDKEVPGANAAYGYRNTTKEIIDEYQIPYKKKFNGLKVGSYDEIYLTVDKDYYFFDYKSACTSLLKKSNAEFKKETAKETNNNLIITNSNKYKYNKLIDCSGSNFFLKRKLNQYIPFRYWIGQVRILNNKPTKLDKNYYYFLFDDEGYLEEIYPFNNKILHGHWQYTKSVDFNLINPPEKTLLKKYINNPKIEIKYNVVGPCSPCFPISSKNYAYLGDSFGNATTSSAVGIWPALDSSKILSSTILKGNLKSYEKKWRKNYMSAYVPPLISRLDRFNNSDFIKKIKKYPRNSEVAKMLKKYPELFIDILDNKNKIKLPEEIKRMFPKHQKIWQLYHYFCLKSKGY